MRVLVLILSHGQDVGLWCRWHLTLLVLGLGLVCGWFWHRKSCSRSGRHHGRLWLFISRSLHYRFPVMVRFNSCFSRVHWEREERYEKLTTRRQGCGQGLYRTRMFDCMMEKFPFPKSFCQKSVFLFKDVYRFQRISNKKNKFD